MNDLVAWLREQLDEDERVALAAYGAKWEVGPTFGARDNRVYVREDGDLIDSVGTCVIAGQVSNVPQFRANAAHIARWDPGRALAEVESKREIIAQYEAMQAGVDAARDTILAGAAKVRLGAYEKVLRFMTIPYVDRPGYDPAWAGE